MLDEASSQQVRWRILVLAGVVLTIVFAGVGLFRFQSDEVARCTIQNDAGVTQQFEFAVGDDVGAGCRYAVDAAKATQGARWWWFGSGAVLALTLASLPLATLRRFPRRDDRDDDEP